ncbi:MAG: M48 family metallopeptidase [Mangrovicoccus sp.]|nr:M48 family metallopeptidase [Mangrovicoccus sp.]
MAEILTVGRDPVITARLRRVTRARRLSLRVSRLDGRVTLSVPRSLPLREAQKFLQERADWVARALAEQPAQILVQPGVQVPVAGQMLPVAWAEAGPARIGAGRILLRPGQDSGPQVEKLLRQQARAALEPACQRFGQRLKREAGRISLRDTRSRWGSCTAAGNVMFSWRLAMAPPEVLTYLAAHEMSHLREMNHGPRFWALVEALCPDYAACRAWLHQHGAELHRYRFDQENAS